MSIEELKACNSSQMGNKGHGSRVPGKDGEEVGLLRLCVFGSLQSKGLSRVFSNRLTSH